MKGKHLTDIGLPISFPRQHLNKLQKKLANGGSEQGTPTTPAKKSRAGKGATPASKRKAALKTEDEDDSSEMETPSKKKHRGQTKASM